VECPAKSS